MLVAPLVALVAPLVAPDHSVCPQPQPSEARQPCSDCSSAVYVVLAVILPERCITYRAHLHKKNTKWVSKSMCASMIHGGKVAQHESYWNKPRGREGVNGLRICPGSSKRALYDRLNPYWPCPPIFWVQVPVLAYFWYKYSSTFGTSTCITLVGSR